MKTVLVFPPFHLQSLYNLPPLGLLNLATILREAGHEVSVLDLVLAMRTGELSSGASIYRNAARMILDREPDLVAFSAQCATTPAVIRIAELLKKSRTEVRIVAGGHDVSFVAERILERFPWFDAIVRGEGEATFPELVSAYDLHGNADRINGVSWRSAGRIVRNPDRELIRNLDDIPVPDYGLVPPLDAYRSACGIPRSIAILEVGRGCPHGCIYCSESVMWRRKTRTFSISRIVDEMRVLRDDFGAECFLLAYDQFTADRRFVEKFCQAVTDEGLNSTPWYCISRLDSVDLPLLRTMREAGCESMCYGIDSGSERTLRFIGKRIDRGILYRRVRETTDEGMVPTLSFVIGFPEEERRDIDETLELALKCGIQGNCNPLIQLPTVLPGTGLHQRYAGRLVRSADTYFSLGLEFDNGRRLSGDIELIESDPVVFSSFHNLPCPGMPLDELDRIAGYFALVANMFPKTFLLLVHALRSSVSSLFGSFISQVSVLEGRETPSLVPDDLQQHLASFADQALAEAEIQGWEHIPEMCRYEKLACRMTGCRLPQATATARISHLAEWKPQQSGLAVVEEFRCNIPAIIEDMKNGMICGRYADQPATLVFVSRQSGLEVVEVNDFGRDLLTRCNGSATVEGIATELYDIYGSCMNTDDFRQECREAIQSLESMEIVQRVTATPPERKEVSSC